MKKNMVRVAEKFGKKYISYALVKIRIMRS
jgi:hypothetical protein